MEDKVDIEPKRYEVMLEPSTEFEEWTENGLYGFLSGRLDGEAAAAEAIAEADEKGIAARAIEYALGNTRRIVISPK
jgi:hypothetical protein